MIKFGLSRTFIVLGWAGINMLTTTSLFAEPEREEFRSPLQSQELNQVRQAGQALLQAKRSYAPTGEAEQIRKLVENVHAELTALSRSMAASSVDIVMTAGANDVPTNVADIGDSVSNRWKQAHRPMIDRLTANLTELRQQSIDIKALRTKAEPGIFQRIGAWLSGDDEQIRLRRLKSINVTDKVLDRLERLDEEIELALNAPPAERQQQLEVLAESLELKSTSKQAQHYGSKQTPTLVTATTHR